MSKFKVGDKVRMLVDKSAGAPNHELHINPREMLGKGQVGEVCSTKKRKWGTAYQVAGQAGDKYYYDEDWLELAEDKPEKPKYTFKKGDIVEFIGSRVDYTTAPKGPVEISDVTDRYVYIQGDMADSGKGWLPEQFKLVGTIPTKPKQKFKVGDKVRCIDDSGQRTINTGCVYQVRDLNVDGLLILKECGGSYMHSRFELVVDKPKEPEQPTLFKPDDFVICIDTTGPVVAGVLKTGKVYKVKSVSDKGNFISLHDITGSFQAKRFAPLTSPATTVVSIDEATTLTLGEQDMSIDTTVAVLNKTYIFGQDADTVTVDTIFNHITRLEAEAAKYDSIKNKPKAIKAKVDALKAEIESLVKFSDEKFSD